MGKGSSGWHIECSAMAYAALGAEIDIHGELDRSSLITKTSRSIRMRTEALMLTTGCTTDFSL